MAKMVVVQVKCDVCEAVVPEAHSHCYTITGGATTVEVDLCDGCMPTMDNIVKVGRPVARRKKPGRKPTMVTPDGVMVGKPASDERPRVVPCDQKGCDYKGADNRSVGVHKRVIHGIKGKHTK